MKETKKRSGWLRRLFRGGSKTLVEESRSCAASLSASSP